jgi:5-methylcytosine-specific restriction endonuclease McrA
MKNLTVTKNRDVHAEITAKRSSKWPALEKKFKQENPTCAACGSTLNLNVHHKKPFHLHPELELEPTNLITLCMDPKTECHIKLGHGDDFRAYNPNVVEDVAKIKADISILNEVAAVAKTNRLLG